MPDEVLRVGAVAELDPDPERELETWRADLELAELDDPAETRERLDAHERGEAAIVRLGLFADVLDGERLRRIDGVHVSGLWFARADDPGNVRHAAEIVTDRLGELRDHLERRGIVSSVAALNELPVRIELDERLAERLHA